MPQNANKKRTANRERSKRTAILLHDNAPVLLPERISLHGYAREASAVFAVPKKDALCYWEYLSDALYGPWASFGVLGDKLKGELQNEIENQSIQRNHAEKGLEPRPDMQKHWTFRIFLSLDFEQWRLCQ